MIVHKWTGYPLNNRELKKRLKCRITSLNNYLRLQNKTWTDIMSSVAFPTSLCFLGFMLGKETQWQHPQKRQKTANIHAPCRTKAWHEAGIAVKLDWNLTQLTKWMTISFTHQKEAFYRSFLFTFPSDGNKDPNFITFTSSFQVMHILSVWSFTKSCRDALKLSVVTSRQVVTVNKRQLS